MSLFALAATEVTKSGAKTIATAIAKGIATGAASHTTKNILSSNSKKKRR